MTERRRAEARRKRTGRSSGENAKSIWLERVWQFAVRPEFVGVLLLVAGLVVILAPTAAVPQEISHGWWVAAYRFADAVQAGTSLTSIAFVAAAAMLVAAWAARRGGGRARLVPLIGTALMGAGVFMGVFVWFGSQASLPTSRVAVPPGQTIQAFPAIESGRAFKVMLPVRVHLLSVSPDAARATVELRKPGEDEGIKNDIFVGDPLPINEFRLALVGLEMDPRIRSAVLGAADGIDVRGTVGTKVRFTPDGPEYEIKAISLNYVGAMGPAVELESEERGRFWVFQRDSQLEEPLNDIRLRRLETSPVAVFAVSKGDHRQLAALAAILFVLGLALFVLASDRGISSLNESGPNREAT